MTPATIAQALHDTANTIERHTFDPSRPSPLIRNTDGTDAAWTLPGYTGPLDVSRALYRVRPGGFGGENFELRMAVGNELDRMFWPVSYCKHLASVGADTRAVVKWLRGKAGKLAPHLAQRRAAA